MADEVSSIGLGVDSSGVRKASEDLKDFVQSGKSAEQEAQRLKETLEKQAKAAEEAGKKARALGEGIGVALRRSVLVVAATAGAAAVAFELLVRRIADYQDLAEMTNADPAGLASMQTAADVAGIKIESIAQSMVRMTNNLSRTDSESSRVAKGLKAIGINVDEFKKLRPDEQFRVLAEQMGKYRDTQEKTALAQILFSLGGARMLRVMKELEGQQRSSNALTNEQIRMADAYVDQQAKAVSETKQFAQQLLTAAIPAMTALQEVSINLVKEFVGVDNQMTRLEQNKALENFAEGVAESIALAVDAVRIFIHSAEGLELKLQEMAANNRVRLAAVTPFADLGGALEEQQKAVVAHNAFLAREFNDHKVFNAVRAAIDRIKTAAAKAAAAGGAATDPRRVIDPKALLGGNAAEREAAKIAKAQLASDLADVQRRLHEYVADFDAQQKELEARRQAGLVDERVYYAEKRRLIQQSLEAEVNALDSERAVLEAQKVTGAEAIQNRQRIADIDSRIAILRAQSASQLTVLGVQETAAANKLTVAYAQAQQALEDYLGTLRRQQERELQGFGQGNAARQRIAGRQQIDDKFTDQRNRLDQNRQLLELEGKFTESARQQYDAQVQLIQTFRDKALKEYEDYYDRRQQLEETASVGLSEALENYAESSRNVSKQVEDVFSGAFKGLEDAIVDFVMTGKSSFNDLVKSVVAGLIRIQTQRMLVDIFDGLFGGVGNKGSLVGSVIGSIFGGFRAGGGDVQAGRAYVVGERRPELFMPTTDGTILPSTSMAGVGPINSTLNVGQGVSRAEVAVALAQNNRELLRLINMRLERRGAIAMTAYAWPTTWRPSSCAIRLVPNVRDFPSPFSGAWSGVDLLGEFFVMTVRLPPVVRYDSGALESFFNRLRGVHTVTAWHFARPVPLGTMRGSPVLAAAAAQGAEQLSVTTTAGATLKAGDMLGVAGQLLQVAEDCVANGSGALTAPLVNRMRVAVSSATAVIWSRPTSEWRLPSVREQGLPVLHEAVISTVGEFDLVQHW